MTPDHNETQGMGHKEWEYASGAEKWKNVLGSLYGSVTAALATSSASARALATYTSASFTGYVVARTSIESMRSTPGETTRSKRSTGSRETVSFFW